MKNPRRERQKRLYEITDPNWYGELYLCIVAYSSAEARSHAFSNENLGGNYGYTDFRVRWRRDIKIDQDMECGELWVEDGLRLGVYSWTENFPCDRCKCEQFRVHYNKASDEILCENCEKFLKNGFFIEDVHVDVIRASKGFEIRLTGDGLTEETAKVLKSVVKDVLNANIHKVIPELENL